MSENGVCLVTGGSSGIGAAIACDLARRGWKVGVGYHSGRERAEELVASIESEGGTALPVGGDMSVEDDVVQAFDRLSEAFGPVTACVVNAGLQADAAFAEMSLDDWRKAQTEAVAARPHD